MPNPTLTASFVRTCLLGVALIGTAPSAALAQTESDAPVQAQQALAPAELRDHTVAPTAHAVRTSASLDIDGVPDEAAWLAAPAITEFTQIKPDEWAPVTERTEVRILYDDYNLYVGGWLYDEGEITTRLGRRDISLSDTDNLIFFLDTFHDHRTAYRFTANPSGVKRDEIITIDGGSNGRRFTGTGLGDTSWDPVWDLATSITDEGWFLEMKIPFGQLAYSPGEVQHWGFQVDRRIARDLEHSSWSFTPALELATVARFGHLEGLSGIRRSGRLELLPFVAARAEYLPVFHDDDVDFDNPYRSGQDYFGNLGLDLKFRLSPNLTLNATINPDFGQVEIDPADLNLTAFETRFNELRPFFVDGGEIFDFGQGGGLNTTVMYTRRIGRAPQIGTPGNAIYADAPGTTTILGALKATGKSDNDWAIGVLDAVTDREFAPYVDSDGIGGEAFIEPRTNYLAARVRRDLNEGRTTFGALVTSVARDLEDDVTVVRELHSQAVTGGIDFRHELPGRRWTLSGEVTPSYVRGDTAAIRATQRTSARYFQRPDAAHLELDPTRTSLAGYGAKLDLARTSGALSGGVTITALSPSLELNDLGFQTIADRLALDTGIGYDRERISRHLRSWSVDLSPGATWNYGGDLIEAGVGVSGSAELMGFHMVNGSVSRSFDRWNDRLTRGGPLTRSPGSYSGNVSFSSDNKLSWAFRLGTGGSRNDDGGWRTSLNGGVTARPSEALEVRVNPSFSVSQNVAQYVTSVGDSFASETFGRRYVFGSLRQTTLSFDTRLNMTFSPTLTLELFAEPFISSGDYGALKELAAPRSFSFLEYGHEIGTTALAGDGRYDIDPDGSGPAPGFRIANQDFNYHSLLGNAVLRWEWRPGSTLFLVWQQSRDERLTNLAVADARQVGDFDFEKDARALLGLSPENIFMVKVSYWTNP